VGKLITRFEDIDAWQLGMELAQRIYELSDAPKLTCDRAFSDQMHRAVISIPSNIAEGFERNSRADFARFLSYAKGSCGELKTQLLLARRIEYLPEETAAALIQLAERIAKATGKFRSRIAPTRWR
jgi:four helix bundle protein